MKVFLSAVTAEFKSCREAVAGDLRAAGIEVAFQEDLRQRGVPLLEKLEREISACDRFIVLLGKAHGASPALPDSSRSYVEWELAFAEGERLRSERAPRKPLYVYIASDAFPGSNAIEESEEARARQTLLVQRVRAAGYDRGHFATVDQLRAQVLRDGLVPLPPRVTQNLPYASLGALFKGRQSVLQALAFGGARRMPDGAVPGAAQLPHLVLHGAGGVGKTRLAIEHAWSCTHTPVRLFVSAVTTDGLRRDLAALAPLLDIQLENSTAEHAQAEATVRWMEQNGDWLLVIDGVDTPVLASEVERLLLRLRAGQVLVTSRLSQWSPSLATLEVPVLEEAAATSFLLERTAGRRRGSSTDSSDARDLAITLDGLALALEQAGAFISTRQCSIADYLRRWRDCEPGVREWCDPRLMHYPRSLAVTWETTKRALTPEAQGLLLVLSFLAPDPIPDFLVQGVGISYRVTNTSGGDTSTAGATGNLIARTVRRMAMSFSRLFGPSSPPIVGDMESALAELVSFSFARRAAPDNTIVIHRVLQDIVRFRTSAEQRPRLVHYAFQLLSSRRLDDPFERRNWERWAALAPHIAHCAEAVLELAPQKAAQRALYEVGAYYFARGQYSTATPLIRRSLELSEDVLESDHPRLVTELHTLAVCLLGTEDYAGAESALRRAHAIAERNPEVPESDRRLLEGRLSEVLIHLERLPEAEAMARSALRRAECGGLREVDLAMALSQLAAILSRKLGALNNEADDLLQRAVAILERVPSNRRLLAAGLNNLGVRRMHIGRPLEEIEPLLRRSIEIRMDELGDSHPDIALSLCNLGQLLINSERVDEGIVLIDKGARLFEQFYGPKHEHLGSILGWRAQGEIVRGHRPEAAALIHEALVQDTEHFGQGHPMAARHVMSLAILRSEQNRHTEAVRLAEGAIVAIVQSPASAAYMGGVVQEATIRCMRILEASGLSHAAANARFERLVRAAQAARKG